MRDNVIDYGEIVKRMKAQNYTGWVGIEYIWIDWEQCNTCDNISETILLRQLLQECAAR